MMFLVGVSGERALFARPEFRNDQISYDFITPHAASAALRTIHDPAPLHWVIDTIRIMSPIRREHLAERGRRLVVLRDVEYIISARIEGHDLRDSDDPIGLVEQSMRHPVAVHLGRPRFPGQAWLIHADDAGSTEAASVDHGWVLHSIAFAGDRQPRFFHARSIAGVVHVPPNDSPLLFG